MPKKWAVPVQLISTFGLAVFLVLYYVLVVQPKEAARYDQMRQSVDSLGTAIGAQLSLVTGEQEERLEELFVAAAANEAADLIVAELKRGAEAEPLAKKIEEALVSSTDSLRGFGRKDGGTVSEVMLHKLRNSDISKQMASRALADWTTMERAAIADECKAALMSAIRRAARAK